MNKLKLGSIYLGNNRCQFCVWAPLAENVDVHIVSPVERVVPLESSERGYYQAILEDITPGSLYFYRLNGKQERPDPASHYQPQGVHGPSQIIDLSFNWQDQNWFGINLEDYVIYELHVGTFTGEGTFRAIIPYLKGLKELGVTALELMPVAQFPGRCDWGYDGVYPFAVQDSYGGPLMLKELVDACHQQGLAVVLDVVYNHLGPEGCYLSEFGHYYHKKYQTPWGDALNFDGPHNDEVRRFFIENALYWISEFHVDALRLDAVHAILDQSAYPFIEELTTAVHELPQQHNRRAFVIAESNQNDPHLITSRELGGYGLDAQWSDDFHHSLHTLLTEEHTGYYQDFGEMQHLAKAFQEGFVYSGEYAPFWQCRRGSSSRQVPAIRFVVFAQNHDHIGNRLKGERLSTIISFEALKLSAGTVILSPFLPLFFMGEEYGETNPFPYFVSFSEPALIESVRQGRRIEFAAFSSQDEPFDPPAEQTFLSAKLNHELRHQDKHGILLNFYQELLRLRKSVPALRNLSKDCLQVLSYDKEQILWLHRWQGEDKALILLNFNHSLATFAPSIPKGIWRKKLDSAEPRWQGPGSTLPETITWDTTGVVQVSPKSLALFVLVTP